MTIVIYSDKNFEQHAILTIKSLKNKIKNDVKIIYYTIGFVSNFNYKNLITHYVEKKECYPKYNFYKIELCIQTIKLYPDDYYFYTDIDVVFSKKIDFDKLKFDFDYPMASYGPVEFPSTFEINSNGHVEVYTEKFLMDYYNVPSRTMPYVWNCIFAFNNKCENFFNEVNDIFKNTYLMENYKKFFPYSDETAFNVCLWKRNVSNNLGQSFLNTVKVDNLIKTEESNLINYGFNSLDQNGFDWEFVNDSKKIIAYHGFKNLDDMKKSVDYIVEKNVIIIGCYVTNDYKKSILQNFIRQIKKTGCDIILTSHFNVDKDILDLVDYFIYDKDNEQLPISNSPIVWIADSKEYINIYTSTHGISIVKNIYNGLNLAKSLGYEKFIYTEYDYILDDSDVYKLTSIFTRLKIEQKQLFFFRTNDGDDYMSNLYQTQMFGGNVKYFLENINIPRTYDEWIQHPMSLGSHSLEKTMTLICSQHCKNIIHAPIVSEFLPNSNTDVFNSYDNNIIAYNIDDINKPLLFIIPKNTSRIYKIIIDDVTIFSGILDYIFKKTLDFNVKYYYNVKLIIDEIKYVDINIDINNITKFKNKAVRKSF